MRKAFIGLVGLSLAAGLAAATGGPALADPVDKTGSTVTGRGDDGPLAAKTAADAAVDELPNAKEDKRRALREEALAGVLTGERKAVTKNGSTVVNLGTKKTVYSKAQLNDLRAGRTVQTKKVDQYVELAREKTDKIFVVLAEFGDQRDPRFPDKDTDPLTPGPAVFDGPVHNAIPAPDRSTDNTTVWQADYSPQHYRNLYFGRGTQTLKSYYEKQSSGRYSVDGEVTDWVKVKYNEARYGRSNDNPKDANGDDPNVCADVACPNTWNLVTDALNQWVVDQKAKGRTDAQVKADVAGFDKWDRYDFDGDGNFNEPDGYIDHFQVVHSGGDQADGDPNQGEDAIWSHRWYVDGGSAGRTGPAKNPLGGTQIAKTGLWVGDYTIQPENGGLSVFAHEYGHDLGLPDHYDTQSSGDNPVSWWTLMAQSRAKAKTDIGLGTRAADLGVWDKLQLGWLDYDVAVAGQQRTFQLGPHEYNSKKAQALAVVLPEKEVTTQLVTPASGTKQWWSGSDNDLTSTLTRSVTLPAGPAQLGFKAAYDIEVGYDYALVEVDDGSGWKAIPTSLSKTGAAAPNGIEGSTAGAYVPGTADLSAYAGKTVKMRFRYTTDGGAAGNTDAIGDNGFFVDDITVTAGGTTVFADDVEGGATGWTAAGFTVAGESITTLAEQFYLASYRAYVAYDKYLQTGPYNFGWASTEPDRAEFFPYQDGLLVNYWDTSFTDNNTSQHPGGGLILPVDSHPDLLQNLTGAAWRGRIQTYDAPFSLQKADSFTLHTNGTPSYIRGQAAQPLFDDTRSYWRAEQPRTGVKTPGVGVTLRVTKQDATSMTVQLGTSKPVSPTATLTSARR